MPRAVLLSAAAVAVFVVGFAGSQLLGNAGAGPPPGASPSATAARTSQPVVIGPLPIGTHASQEFQPPVTFDIVDQGWTANRDAPGMLGLIRDVAPRGGLYFTRIQDVIANPCVEGGEAAQTGPGVADLLTELGNLDHLTLSDVQPVQVGGFPGQQVDVTVADGALAACGGLVGGEVPLFVIGDEVWRAVPGERFRLISVGVGDQPVTSLLSTDWTQTPSVQELEGLLELGQRVLDSVELPTTP